MPHAKRLRPFRAEKNSIFSAAENHSSKPLCYRPAAKKLKTEN